MSTQAPQVLSRKANGTANGTADDPVTKQPSKGGKASNDGNQTTKSAKGRGAADRRGGSSRNANDGEQVARPSRSKAHNEGEKLLIRRLPPGMTRDEFASILGADWEVSGGKVDWFSYAPGKISTDPAKPSRPSRAYIHLMRKDDIMPLSDVVRNSTWEDAKATFTNPSLIGPPVLEFCVYKKVPGTKRRADARQGTIDQDPEFMGFLEALANPAPMRDSIDVEDPDEAAKVDTKITTTPLVEYLKEKKANKGKDGKSKSGKGKGGKDEESSSKKRGKEPKGDKSDKPSKESVKILTKKATAMEQAADGAKKAASQIAAANAASSAADGQKSRRAGIAAAARLLQRDLGLSPGSAHRRARHDAAKAEADAKAGKDTPTTGDDSTTTATESAVTDAPPSSSQVSKAARSESPANPSKDKASGRRNRSGKDKAKGASTETVASTQPTAANPPVILKKKTDATEPEKKASEPPTSTATSVPTPSSGKANAAQSGKEPKEKGSGKQTSQKKQAAISASATRAFVKHVNVSQGANDAALREALGAFGTITLVEIDKRKGFAYVDFAEHAGLVKAANASPVQVGQCSVQVLERKDKKPAAAATNGEKGERGEKGEKGGKGEKNEKNEKSEKGAAGRGKRGRGGKAGSGSAPATSTPTQSTTDAAPAATSGG